MIVIDGVIWQSEQHNLGIILGSRTDPLLAAPRDAQSRADRIGFSDRIHYSVKRDTGIW